MLDETIAAISTPLGEGGISIIRVSGKEAIDIADQVFKGKISLKEAATHTIHYGKIMDQDAGSFIDEVLVSVMRRPRTYTAEDIVEINCHGGITASQSVLQLVLSKGAVLAQPGEFTKRAFLNGRIDLSQAEAVMDLIQAKSHESLIASAKQVKGSLSSCVRQVRAEMLDLLADIEASIDYPEYDVEDVKNKKILHDTEYVIEKIDWMLEKASSGKLLRDGVRTVIAGKPNVGKSSLLNMLLQEERAIVTDIPGTTRDTISEYVRIGQAVLHLIDTAGIRETKDVVESIGVEKTIQAAETADLVIIVLDGSKPLEQEDLKIFELFQEKKVLLLINKCDLAQSFSVEKICGYVDKQDIISISAKENIGIEAIGDWIETAFFAGKLESDEMPFIANQRHLQLLHLAKSAMQSVKTDALSDVPQDLISIDLMDAYGYLGEIIGESVDDDVIRAIFSKFCLGK